MRLDVFSSEINSIRVSNGTNYTTLKISLKYRDIITNNITIFFDDISELNRFIDDLSSIAEKLRNDPKTEFEASR